MLNIVKTAVKNDGVIGSVSKLLKLSSNFSDSAKKRAQRPSPKGESAGSEDELQQDQSRDADIDNDTVFRKKSIHIKSDDEATPNEDCFSSESFAGELKNTISAASGPSEVSLNGIEGDAVPKRRSISVKSHDEDIPPIVKNMMTMDDSSDAPPLTGKEPG